MYVRHISASEVVKADAKKGTAQLNRQEQSDMTL